MPPRFGGVVKKKFPLDLISVAIKLKITEANAAICFLILSLFLHALHLKIMLFIILHALHLST